MKKTAIFLIKKKKQSHFYFARNAIFTLNKKDLLPPKAIIADFEGTIEEKSAYHAASQLMQCNCPTSFRAQIKILMSFLHNDHIRVSFERIAKLFGVSKQSIANQYNKILKEPLQDGRPPSLNDSEITIIENEIDKLHNTPSSPIYPSYNDIYDFVSLKLNKNIPIDTLRHILNSKLGDKFKSCIGIPLEIDRSTVDINDIEENLHLLKTKIQGIHSSFIFNLDECGYTEYADAREKKLIVPVSYSKLTVTYPVARKMKHASVLACISPNGFVSKPLFTVQRYTVDSDLFKYIPYNSIDIVQTDSGFLNTSSFRYWMDNSFIPHVRNLRKQFQYDGKAILIMDGFIGHHNGLETLDLSNEKIDVHFLVPHSSDQLQPLDVSIFGSMKRFASNVKTPQDSSILTKQIIKMHQSLMQACTQINCKAAFRACGIITEVIKCEQQI